MAQYATHENVNENVDPFAPPVNSKTGLNGNWGPSIFIGGAFKSSSESSRLFSLILPFYFFLYSWIETIIRFNTISKTNIWRRYMK